MSNKKKFMTLEMQLFCIQEKEAGKSLSQICQSVHRKFNVATSKSVVHRLLREEKKSSDNRRRVEGDNFKIFKKLKKKFFKILNFRTVPSSPLVKFSKKMEIVPSSPVSSSPLGLYRRFGQGYILVECTASSMMSEQFCD